MVIVLLAVLAGCKKKSVLSVLPVEMNAFGHETVTVSDTACTLPTAIAKVTAAGIEAVLAEVSPDRCRLTFNVQGGPAGPARIEITPKSGAPLTVDGLSYKPSMGDGIFDSSWVIGESQGSAMGAFFLSYDSQVRDGIFSFFFRQLGTYNPHPLIRKEGVPKIVTIADIDPATGILNSANLMTTEILPYLMDQKPLSDLRLNLDTVHQNQSVPGMHDVLWPFLEKMYEGQGITYMYERIIRFPGDIPDHPKPIMDVIEEGNPTFVVVTMGVVAYNLDARYVAPNQLSQDFDKFLGRLKNMSSKPTVLAGTVPDTASLPARPFSYAERYYGIEINNLWHEALARANSGLTTPRFHEFQAADFYTKWMEADTTINLGGKAYPVTKDASGRPRVMIKNSAGEAQPIGMGRFQGFFTMDHVHLTPTGHAIVANMILEALNRELGPNSANPRLSANAPYIDLAPILDRDPETPARLVDKAVAAGLNSLESYLDPLPPRLTNSERCGIKYGAYAASPQMQCPQTVTITEAGGGSCSEATFGTLPATVVITVKDQTGSPMSGAAVGIAALPTGNYQHMKYIATPNLTDVEGQISVTIDKIEAEQKGGKLKAISGLIEATCPLPN